MAHGEPGSTVEGSDPVAFGGRIRDDQLRGIGRRGRAHVGDEVEQRGVDIVTDRGHHRGGCGGHGAKQGLVAERQQLLDGAAATGDDDDVDSREPVQRASARWRSSRRW